MCVRVVFFHNQKTKRKFEHRTRHPSTQVRPVKIPTSSKSRQSLEVITEEVAQQYTRRRKQLIPRARLKRAEEPVKRLQGSRSPGLHPQHIPKIRSHQELRLLLTPPPDFRTDDFCISEDTKRRFLRPDEYKYLKPLAEEDYRQTTQFPEPIYVTKTISEVDFNRKISSQEYTQPTQYPEPIYVNKLYPEVDFIPRSSDIKKPISPEADYIDTPTLPKSHYITNTHFHENERFRSDEPNEEKDCFNRRIAPPSDLIGIPFEKDIRKRPRNNGEIHSIKIEGVNSRSNVIPLTTGRINSKTLVKSKACSLSKLNITNVIVSDCSDREFTERLYQSANFAQNSTPHISTYVVNEPEFRSIPRFSTRKKPILEEAPEEVSQSNQNSEFLRTSRKQKSLDDIFTNDTYSEESEDESEDLYTEVNLSKTDSEEDKKSLICKEDRDRVHNNLRSRHTEPQEKSCSNSNLKFTYKREKYNGADTLKLPDSNGDVLNKNVHPKNTKKTNLNKQTEATTESERPKYIKNNKQGSSRTNANSNKIICKDKEISKINLDRSHESTIYNTKEDNECFLGLRSKIVRNYLSQEDQIEETREKLNANEQKVNITNRNKNKEDIKHSENKEENENEGEYNTPFDFCHVKEKAAKFQELSNDIYDKVTSERRFKPVVKDNTFTDRKINLDADKSNQKQNTNDKQNVIRSISYDTGNVTRRESEVSNAYNSEDKTDNKGNCNNRNQANTEFEKSKTTSTARLIYNYMRGKPKRSESVRLVKNETQRGSQSLPTSSSFIQKDKFRSSSNAYELGFNSDISNIKSCFSENSQASGAKSLETLSVSKIEKKFSTVLQDQDKYPSASKCRFTSNSLKTEDSEGILTTQREKDNLRSELNEDSETNKKITEGDNSASINNEESKDNSNNENTMSRRPQVLKITDSATTSSPPRCSSGERRDIAGYGVIRQRTQDTRPTSEDNTNVTRKMRTIFEGTPSSLNEKEESENVEEASEKVSPTKPILIATLSVEDGGDTLGKPNRREETSPPVQVLNSQNLPEKTPAFRAFSCNGQETFSSLNRSVPDLLDVSQNKIEFGDKSQLKERDYKVAAFDGLLQYLQDYRHGLRELLVNNNVVIIEPVRQSKVKLEDQKYAGRKSKSESTCRITGATVKSTTSSSNTTPGSNTLPRQQKSQQPVLRRHFFYHPKKTNRELLDEELPDPDKVRNAREMFERTLKMKIPTGENFKTAVNTKCDHAKPIAKPVHDIRFDNTNAIKAKRKYLTVDTVFRQNVLQKRWTDTGSLSSGVSSDLSCYDTDLESPCSRGENFSRNSNHKEETPDIFSSDDNDYADDSDSKHCYLDDGDEGHYVSPEILEKIRACGTTVTYYGGQVISCSNGPVRSPMTLAIMNEIRNSKNSTKKGKEIRIIKDEYLGMKFRLVKSNSCSSRLELAGTEDEGNFKDEWSSTEGKIVESHEDGEMDDEPAVTKCDPKQEIVEVNQREEVKLSTIEEKSNEEKMTTVETLDNAFKRLDETSFMLGKANMYENFQKGGPPRMCFSPEKGKLIEKGSNVLFDDMEFEEFEIAEDSLNAVEVKEADSQKNEKNELSQDVVENSNDLSQRSNGDVQMTTWASRSVLFDFRNSEAEGPHLPTQKSNNNQSTC